jgi:hypothetical protein
VHNRMTYGRAEFDPSSLPHRFGDDVTVNESKSQTSSTKVIDFMNDHGNYKKEEDKKDDGAERGCDDNLLNRSNSGKTDCDGNNDKLDINTSTRTRRERGRGVNDLLGLSDHDEDEEEDEDDWGLLENPVVQDAYQDEDGRGDGGGEGEDLSSGTTTAPSKRKSGMTHSFNNSIYSVSSLSPSPSSTDTNATADAALLVFGNTVLGGMGYTVKSRHVPYTPTAYSTEESKEDRETDREEVKAGEFEDIKEGSVTRAQARAGAGASVCVEKDEKKGEELKEMEEAVWKVTVIASASYVVHVSLTAELKVIKASERSLSWVNGTLLGGVNRDKSPPPGGLTGLHVPQDLLEFTPPNPDKEILRTHDVRTRLTSTKRLYPCDALYKAVCPHGLAPIEIDPTTQLPRSSLHLPEGYRVIFARKLHDRTYYQYSDTECGDDEYQLHTLIRVTRSTHYEGENGNLNNQRDISDLNLQINIDPLIAYHQYPSKHSTPAALSKINRFLTRAISHSVLLSDRIEATHNTV